MSGLSFQVDIRTERYLESEGGMCEVKFGYAISAWKLRKWYLFAATNKINNKG